MEEIVGIDVGGNTVDAILNITGNEPDEDIILEIIKHYARMFAECDKGSGYRFVMLTNKIREHYEQLIEEKERQKVAREVEYYQRKRDEELSIPEDVRRAMSKETSRRNTEKAKRRAELFKSIMGNDYASNNEGGKIAFDEPDDGTIAPSMKILHEYIARQSATLEDIEIETTPASLKFLQEYASKQKNHSEFTGADNEIEW